MQQTVKPTPTSTLITHLMFALSVDLNTSPATVPATLRRLIGLAEDAAREVASKEDRERLAERFYRAADRVGTP